ncbi:hypothetical protein [Tenacibaculum sp. 190130A14a]|uniref:hypothetical protein n=1 Tax=Tenacibaculum polynesiense TaxID=3137857 RepID=UPI0032B23AF0
MSKKENKCQCGAGYKITCYRCSLVKMVMLLKNGNNHLKYRTANNSYANPVWYNHLSKNNKPVNTLVNAMYKRFQKSKYTGVTNKLMFYNNQTKQHITTIETH